MKKMLIVLIITSYVHADVVKKEIEDTNIDLMGAWNKVKGNVQQNFSQAKEKVKDAVQEKLPESVKTTLPIVQEKIQTAYLNSLPAVKDNPYKNQAASVRQGNELCAQERAYLAVRGPKVRSGLEQFLGRSLDGKYVPKIALVGSGGGYRAMLCTMGSLIGAQKNGLLAGTTYISALSGSTWMLAGWLSHNETLDAFKSSLLSKLTKRGSSPLPGIVKGITANESNLIAQMLLSKTGFKQPITAVDLYGAFLANSLFSDFGDRRQMVHLSEQVARIQSADLPLPIYTSVRGDSAAPMNACWYEFTPYEVGAAWMGSGMYVPSWAYGRKFANGQSVDFAPEQSIGFLMGTWGSAFAAQFGQMYEQAAGGIQNAMLKTGANFVMTNLLSDVGQKRITKAWAEVFNFSAGLSNSPLQDRTELKLVDAGARPGFNLPYPPISGERPERRADIIILLDASADDLAGQMRQVEQYARAKNLKFPAINYDGIDKRAISIFRNEQDPTVPVVIYMPRVKDLAAFNEHKAAFPDLALLLETFDVEKCVGKEFCSTFNFEYELNESNQLSVMTEFNMRSNAQAIKDAVNWWIDRHSVK